MNAWAMPYVTNHRYKIHWRNGLDWEKMRITLSERWVPSDHNLGIVMNHTDVRVKVDFNFNNFNPVLTI